ncbi:hypothetical protein ACOPW8_000412, partial [Escherichia coli]
IMKLMFHSEIYLAKAGYWKNPSMILSGLSLLDKVSPLYKTTAQARNPRRDTACGLLVRENWPIFSAQEG